MKSKIRRIYGIIMGFIIQAVCLYRWIPVDGQEVCSLRAFLWIIRSENTRNASAQILNKMTEASGKTADDLYAMMIFLFIASLAVVQILGLIYIPLSFKGRGLMLCGISGLIFCAVPVFFATELMYEVDEPAKMLGASGFALLTVGMTFVGCRLLDAYDEAVREARELKERDKAFKKERKRRLKFKGSYSSLFYQIIFANCRNRLSDYITFVTAGSMAAGFIISGFGMWTLLKGQELNSILLDFLVLSMIVSIFLLVNILLFYLKSRMKGYGILLNLGMRRMTLRFYMAVELIVCIFLSVACGFILGNGLLWGLRTLLVKKLGSDIITGHMTGRTWLMILVSIGLMFLISLIITHDNYYNPETSGASDRAVIAEPLGVKYHLLYLISGSVFVYGALHFFRDSNMAEGLLFPGFFLLGSYLLLKCLWGALLRFKEKVNAVSYKTILLDNYKYYRFKTTFRYMFFLTVLHVIILFVYAKDIAATMTAEEPEKLFPYDYVCIADTDDMKDFEMLSDSGLTELTAYPMVRVSGPGLADEFIYDMDGSSIGQHIGISETSYRQICEHAGRKAKKLDLSADGSDIHVVYQQDRAQKAHALGNFLMEENTFLHIGSPEIIKASNSGTWIRSTKAVYEERIIKSEEAFMITGALHQGSQENIIVFSDAYMQSLQPENGTRQLILLNLTSEESRPAVEEMLAAFRERHAEEESYDADVTACYDKTRLVSRISRERAMHTEVNVFIIVLFIITGFIMFYMKVIAEMDERKRQHTFLALIGMGPKKRHQLIYTEFRDFLILPLAAATLITGGFLRITLELRMYTAADTFSYAKAWGTFYAVYVLLQTVGAALLTYYTIKEVDKE